MLEYSFTPLDKQYDDGFGAVGLSFKEAAESLTAEDDRNKFLHNHLPFNFLYRHSIELFLKGIIIILHRRLQLPYGDALHDRNPRILISGKWKELYQVHGIGELYNSFKSMVTTYSLELKQIADTDWAATPNELDEWICNIDEADQSSTFFRYPVTKNLRGDIKKSSIQETTPKDVLVNHKADGKLVKALMFTDDNDTVINTYKFIDEPMSDLSFALKNTADLLSGAHLGLMAELVYSQKTPPNTSLERTKS